MKCLKIKIPRLLFPVFLFLCFLIPCLFSSESVNANSTVASLRVEKEGIQLDGLSLLDFDGSIVKPNCSVRQKSGIYAIPVQCLRQVFGIGFPQRTESQVLEIRLDLFRDASTPSQEFYFEVPSDKAYSRWKLKTRSLSSIAPGSRGTLSVVHKYPPSRSKTALKDGKLEKVDFILQKGSSKLTSWPDRLKNALSRNSRIFDSARLEYLRGLDRKALAHPELTHLTGLFLSGIEVRLVGKQNFAPELEEELSTKFSPLVLDLQG